MLEKPKLPITLNMTYWEPETWVATGGTVYVSVMPPAEVALLGCAPCIFSAKTKDGVILGAFQFISDALLELTARGCAIKWQVVRGREINERQGYLH